MADVFNSQATVGDTFRGTNFQLNLGTALTSNNPIVGALVQEFSLQYARQVTRIYEIGSRQQYYVEGSTQGQMALSQIIGPKAIVDDLLSALSDICNAYSNSLTLAAGARLCPNDPANTNATPSTVTAGYCVATSLGISGSVGNFIINKSVAIMFTTLNAN